MESDISAVRARIQVVGHRLIGLAERGVDTAGLQSRLVQAGDLLEGGAVEDARGLVDDVASEVRRAAAGEARASGELQGVIRDRLQGELREAIDGGLADVAVEKMMTDLRREMETRLETFERRLREQFARELAQVVSSRPWMKDILAQRAGESPSGRHASAIQPSTALFAQLREQVSGLRQRIEKGGTDRIDRALGDLAAAEEGMADLVANVADFQAQLGERVLALEERLASAIAPAPAAVTRLTDLHVEVDPAPPAPGRSSGEQAVGTQAWPFGDESRSDGPSLTQTTIERMVDAATSSVVAPVPAPEAAHHTPHPMPALRGPQGTEAHALETSQTPHPMPVTSGMHRVGVDVGQIRRLIEERLATWKAPAGEGLITDDDELVGTLVRLMPQVLEDGAVRTALFATIALEAIEKPGALAHLSGLRDFLKQELAQAGAV